MTQKKIEYSIQGYRYAPESFRAFRISPDGNKESIPLSGEQRSELGNTYLTKGRNAAIDYIKRIERERERKCRLYMTYGFMSQESPRTYLYCEQLHCREDAPVAQRLRLFREFKDYLKRQGCKIITAYECPLDGQYRPTEVKEHCLTADLSRPVIVWLKIT